MNNKIYNIAVKVSSGIALNTEENTQLAAIKANAEENAALDELNFVLQQSELPKLDLNIDVEKEWDTFKQNRARLKRQKTIRLITTWSSAAVVALLVGVFALTQRSNTTITYATADAVQQFTLPDNSTLSLNKHSELSLDKNFNAKNRTVHLQGEGFFKVTSNKDLPFQVQLNNGTMVEVLGTQFNLRSYDNELITDLQVIEGKVAFGLKDEVPELILEKGNKAQYNVTEDDFTALSEMNKHINTWENGQFKFDNTPVGDMIESFERYFNKEIVYPKGEGALNYSGHFNQPNEIDFAKVISLAFGWNYQITTTQIVFVKR